MSIPDGTADFISILTHAVNPATKTWKTNGEIVAAEDVKYFTHRLHRVEGITELSDLLTSLEKQTKSQLIRGSFVGSAVAQQRDPEFQKGKVRRANDYFDDQPLHTVLIDIDGYHGTIDEFIRVRLPHEFHDVSYHWQFSSSMGHHSKAAEGMRAHVWFWLDSSLTSAQLKAYAKEVSLPADMALFQPVQAHYTANPIFEPGCVDPIDVRSGFVEGIVDTVHLTVSEQAMAAIPGAAPAQVLLDIAESDPVLISMQDRGMVISKARDAYNIVCPYDDEHSGKTADSSTQYFLANTGGHSQSHFKCLHASCEGRMRSEFLHALGVGVCTADDFEDLSTDPAVVHEAKAQAARMYIESAEEFVVRRKGSWLIDDVLPDANLGMIYGASGSGKSFLALDMLGALAQGKPWNGHAVEKPVNVLWLTAEGQEDMRKRVAAYCIVQQIDPKNLNIDFITDCPSFMDLKDVKFMIKQILAKGEPGYYGLIAVDTLAQVMGGGNENASEDMGLVLKHCKAITEAVKAMVELIHHAGKDERAGARGHSSLRAACDSELEVSRPDINLPGRVATVTKLKGGADGGKYHFVLPVYTFALGQGDRREERTCYVEYVEKPATTAKDPAGVVNKAIMDKARELMAVPESHGQITQSELSNVVGMEKPAPLPGVRDQRVSNTSTAIDKLVRGGHLLRNDVGVLRIPPANL